MSGTFSYELKTEKLYLKYAKGAPSVTSQEFHYHHEFVFFLEGSAYFISKDIQQKLPDNCLIVIPKEQFHQFRVSDADRYTRCILGFPDSSEIKPLIDDVMTQIKILPISSGKIIDVFTALAEIAKSALTEDEKALFIKSSLAQLLIYLKYDNHQQILQNSNISPLVQRAIAYIDSHYAEKLTIDSIAQELYVSTSTLAHTFSKELGISIYRYISKKRLLEVHKRIQQGESPTSAATKCGFGDYSCYYRIYKKYAD